MKRMPARTLLLSFCCLLLPAAAVHAGCSRPMLVPVSPTGLSATVTGDQVSGVYPEVLKSIQDEGDCNFKFLIVPRARQEAMFETGKADILVPASRTPRRDKVGYFVPLAASRAALISLQGKREPIHSMQQLRENKSLRIALVRGYDYGEPYLALQKDLAKEGRVFLEPDIVGVARLLQAGFADVTMMSPSLLAGAIQTDPRVQALATRLRIEPLDELPWGESGAYISRSSVSDADRAIVENALNAAAKSGKVWNNFKRFYSADVLADSIRPRQ
jgi:polar amino acid transport system substrate-binding protein